MVHQRNQTRRKVIIFLLDKISLQVKISFFAVSIVLISNFSSLAYGENPADYFDLKQWKITLPIDENKNGRADEISVKKIRKYSHPDFFYLDKNKHMVFTTPNKATTTSGSKNTRSELRQMIKGKDAKSPRNNFALKAHNQSAKFGSIGGKLQATLKVNHVAEKAYRPNSGSAFSVVVGQIHAGKDPKMIAKKEGFGWGNEPLKIVYKKWPKHNTGSVFWSYELNLSKHNKLRRDISYPVWGNVRGNSDDPGSEGIALNQEFTYVVNVYENIVYLTFKAKDRPTINYSIDLTNNIDAYGRVDTRDHPQGYAQEWFYFKAGAYNQCNGGMINPFWGTGCAGTGDWQTDVKNGDYVQVTFSKLLLSDAESR